mmetsp:Transcript_930/g.1591  ORF Transcript_930/g.1591 Transcript_930/m.1591 type:complete len:230 (+) Transcript_930:205-894(+)
MVFQCSNSVVIHGPSRNCRVCMSLVGCLHEVVQSLLQILGIAFCSMVITVPSDKPSIDTSSLNCSVESFCKFVQGTRLEPNMRFAIEMQQGEVVQGSTMARIRGSFNQFCTGMVVLSPSLCEPMYTDKIHSICITQIDCHMECVHGFLHVGGYNPIVFRPVVKRASPITACILFLLKCWKPCPQQMSQIVPANTRSSVSSSTKQLHGFQYIIFLFVTVLDVAIFGSLTK